MDWQRLFFSWWEDKENKMDVQKKVGKLINVKKELFVFQRENLKYIRCGNVKHSERHSKNWDFVQKEEDNSRLDVIEDEVQPQFCPLL